jgi:inner membrane protein
LLYRTNTTISGTFNTLSLAPVLDKSLHSLNLVMAVSDMRGIGVDTQVTINKQITAIEPGTQLNVISDGIHIALDAEQLKESAKIEFDISMDLLGMESLNIIPIGKKSTVSLKSDWPHPSFNGEYLPMTSHIDETGFTAKWQTSYFATNIESLVSQCIYRTNCNALKSRSFGVYLIDPVDHYLKSHRAINYALLIITLAFVCFFLVEVIRKQPIHPIQYGFVGLALALFYLLLLSLSEHLGFNLAYAISATASTALLASYVGGILQNKRHTVLFSSALACLYGLMFILLGAEDLALILGSLLIFAVLSVVMLLTKNFNWYSQDTDN